MDRRATRRQARHEQILAAAMQIVQRDGLEGLTIARLAGDLNAAVGAIYRYFPGKDALLAGLQLLALETLDQTLTALEARTRARLARGQPAPGAAALTRVLVFPLGYLLHARQEPARHRLIDAVLSAPTPVLEAAAAARIEAALEPLLGRCAAALDEATLGGALQPGPALVRTHALWAAVHGLEHFAKRDRLVPPELASTALARTLLGGLLVGWGARPADAERALDLAVAAD